jgi:hypothetical protein
MTRWSQPIDPLGKMLTIVVSGPGLFYTRQSERLDWWGQMVTMPLRGCEFFVGCDQRSEFRIWCAGAGNHGS